MAQRYNSHDVSISPAVVPNGDSARLRLHFKHQAIG